MRILKAYAIVASVAAMACSRSAASDDEGAGGERSAPHHEAAAKMFGGWANLGDAATPAQPSCPIDAEAVADLEEVIEDAVADATWIASNSRGIYEAPRRRAFAVTVPFTSLTEQRSVLVDGEPCSAPTTFGAECDAVGPSLSLCDELLCKGVGPLAADAWMDPLPSIVPALAGGEISVNDLAHTTSYSSNESGDLDLGWATRYALTLPNGGALSVSISGSSAIVDAQIAEINLALTLTMDALEGREIDVTAYQSGDGAIRGTADFEGKTMFSFAASPSGFTARCAE